MAEDKYADEVLGDEQLEQVAGGSTWQIHKDYAFFQALDIDGGTVANFRRFGVEVSLCLQGDNSYRFQGAHSYARHPRDAALGYVLAQVKYPGYNGQWWDLDYTRDFIRKNFDGLIL